MARHDAAGTTRHERRGGPRGGERDRVRLAFAEPAERRSRNTLVVRERSGGAIFEAARSTGGRVATGC
ncbi:MAG TPA: hypothetical protein VH142_20880, partial [Polyangiaceae bacterium]|nr:hypothetical protein [Polyangiaceae bacterium]